MEEVKKVLIPIVGADVTFLVIVTDVTVVTEVSVVTETTVRRIVRVAIKVKKSVNSDHSK